MLADSAQRQTTRAGTGCHDLEAGFSLQRQPVRSQESARRSSAPQQNRPSASTLRRQRRHRASEAAVLQRPRQRTVNSESGNRRQSVTPASPAPSPDQLLADLEEGGRALASALDAIKGRVATLSFEAEGCRVVQLALEVAEKSVSAELAEELRGHVCDAIRSPHANYVIQKLIEVLPLSKVRFVAEELCGAGIMVSRHRYGCRIICRLIEHTAGDAELVSLIDEVLSGASGLCRHSFGHYVIQSILEHGTPEQRHCIVNALLAELERHLQSRNSCYVLEHALSYGSPEDRLVLAQGLAAGGPQQLAELPQHQCGSQLVRAMLRVLGEDAAQVLLQQLREESTQLHSAMREPLVAQAVRFLRHGGVQDAPWSEQRAFLGLKGLTEEEVTAAQLRVKSSLVLAGHPASSASLGGDAGSNLRDAELDLEEAFTPRSHASSFVTPPGSPTSSTRASAGDAQPVTTGKRPLASSRGAADSDPRQKLSYLL